VSAGTGSIPAGCFFGAVCVCLAERICAVKAMRIPRPTNVVVNANLPFEDRFIAILFCYVGMSCHIRTPRFWLLLTVEGKRFLLAS
jgi:hypothetical protein